MWLMSTFENENLKIIFSCLLFLTGTIGYYETHVRALIWRLSFAKCFLSIFFPEKCVPNRFWHTRGNSPSAVSETTTAKTSEWERASIKTRGPGACPGVFSGFLRRKPPARSRAGNHVAGLDLRWSKWTTLPGPAAPGPSSILFRRFCTMENPLSQLPIPPAGVVPNPRPGPALAAGGHPLPGVGV